MHWTNIVTIVLAAVGLVVGWVLALSVRTQARARVYEKRLEAYAGLWHALQDLPLGHKDVGDPDDIGDEDRKRIAGTLTDWYYAEKGGLLLTEPTRVLWQTLRNEHRSQDLQPGTPVHPTVDALPFRRPQGR